MLAFASIQDCAQRISQPPRWRYGIPCAHVYQLLAAERGMLLDAKRLERPQMRHLLALGVFLCDELHNTAGFLDLALGVLAEVAGADDERDFGETTLAENFAVAEREEVEDGRGVGLGALCKVLLALLERDERPELWSECYQ